MSLHKPPLVLVAVIALAGATAAPTLAHARSNPAKQKGDYGAVSKLLDKARAEERHAQMRDAREDRAARHLDASEHAAEDFAVGTRARRRGERTTP